MFQSLLKYVYKFVSHAVKAVAVLRLLYFPFPIASELIVKKNVLKLLHAFQNAVAPEGANINLNSSLAMSVSRTMVSLGGKPDWTLSNMDRGKPYISPRKSANQFHQNQCHFLDDFFSSVQPAKCPTLGPIPAGEPGI